MTDSVWGLRQKALPAVRDWESTDSTSWWKRTKVRCEAWMTASNSALVSFMAIPACGCGPGVSTGPRFRISSDECLAGAYRRGGTVPQA